MNKGCQVFCLYSLMQPVCGLRWLLLTAYKPLLQLLLVSTAMLKHCIFFLKFSVAQFQACLNLYFFKFTFFFYISLFQFFFFFSSSAIFYITTISKAAVYKKEKKKPDKSRIFYDYLKACFGLCFNLTHTYIVYSMSRYNRFIQLHYIQFLVAVLKSLN